MWCAARFELPIQLPADLLDQLLAECVDEDANDYHAHSRAAANTACARPILDGCRRAVEAVAGVALASESTYFRIYQRGSYLLAHRDREGLDWTISLMLRCDAPPWPLEVQRPDGEWMALEGRSVLVKGREVLHRRTGPYAGDEACVLMLHYREVET